MEKLTLEKCMLDPEGRKGLKYPIRVESRCYDCSKCGWNKDVFARRMAQAELKWGKNEMQRV